MALENNQGETEWVAKFVQMGVPDHEARALYRRMQISSASTPPAPSLQLRSDLESKEDLFGDVAVPKKNSKIVELSHVSGNIRRSVGRPPVLWEDRRKSQQELDLFELTMEIDAKNAKEHNQVGFIATAMIYASLPHSAVEGAIFKRKNGDLSLTIMNDPEIGIPYGKIPRIITAFLCTEAKRNSDPNIDLGHTQAEFAKKLGLTKSGGVRGDMTRLKDQALRLFTAHITLVGSPNSEFHWNNVNITDSGILLWNPQENESQSQWISKIKLSEYFYEECRKHSVPIDLRVLNHLRSPLAIDIYIWMTYRYNTIIMSTPVSWKQLKWQFGANYADNVQGLHNFIVNFKNQLRAVQTIYPAAKFSVDQHKLTLHRSRPHILPAP